VKLEYDEPLLNFAFKFNLRRYIMLQREIIDVTNDSKTFCRVGMPYWHGPLSHESFTSIRSNYHIQRRNIRWSVHTDASDIGQMTRFSAVA
jgi:hypothetical protein